MDKLKLLWSKTNRWHRVIFVFLVAELRLLPKYERGFECNDPSLSHPFTGDTISWKWLLATVAMLPLAVMLIVEKLYSKNDSGQSKRQALCWYREYFYGGMINMTIVQILKVIVREPRPHFFDTCSPKEALSCTGGEYVSSYTCAQGIWVHQSDTSFPSGHSSLALHTGFFIAYYLHQRTKHLVRSNVILALQILSIVIAVYCGISRITDRRHHWWDVLSGAAIGVPILFYTVMTLCKNFDCPNMNNDTRDKNSDSAPMKACKT